jgi:hypothetical protein
MDEIRGGDPRADQVISRPISTGDPNIYNNLTIVRKKDRHCEK